jgi:hypothetical protein
MHIEFLAPARNFEYQAGMSSFNKFPTFLLLPFPPLPLAAFPLPSSTACPPLPSPSSRSPLLSGYHLGLYPENDPELVEDLAKLLEIDLKQVVTMRNTANNNVLIGPCTVRALLSQYYDIAFHAKKHVRDFLNFLKCFGFPERFFFFFFVKIL